MKKICFYLCAWAVFALSLNPLFAQTPLEVEYQHSGLTLDGLDDIEGFNPGFMDYTDDACMSYRVGQTLVIRFLGSQEIFLLSPDDIGDPDYDLNQYKFGGFHDVAGDAEKELILLPKINNDGPIYCCNLGNNNHFTPKWVVNDGKTHRKIYIQNLDGDLKAEIIVMIGNPIGLGGTVTIGIYGEGFTPGLTDGDPTAHSDKGETCMLESFETQKTFPPHFRWPENRSFLPPGSRDLDGDGKNDFIHILEEEGIFYVVSGRTHEVLYTSGILQDILISSYVRAAFIDFCGTGQKQILLCASNTSAELRDMEIILIIDTSTGELNWAYQPYLDSGYRLRSFKFTLENTMVSIMSHQNSGRVIAVGPGDGFQGGGGANLGGEAPPSDDSQEYTLFMVWESVNAANTFIPDKKDFTVSDLDANGDNIADEPVRVTQDSTSDITAGFYVYDGITGDAIWQTPVQPGVPVDPAPYFHG
ncbi:MAG: hypothetical protein H7246_18275, partial [Phycisphaerae bacterium]|nr:hypothetical protein [Saprospiraceae bacterium]